jgi:tripartite-type tricarboxylate transporter receptor subunit TctC
MRNDYQYDFDSVNFLNFAGFNKMVIISGKHSSLADLKTECLKNKTISFGSSGVGSTSHLSAYYFATKYLNCKDILSVPYRGVSMVYPDLKAGRIDFMADFAISVDSFIESKYFNHIEDLKETDLVSWHIFVSNKTENKDAEIVQKVFDSIKADKKFTKDLESKFQIFKFSENKDSNWLKQQFNIYKTVIDTLPKQSTTQ